MKTLAIILLAVTMAFSCKVVYTNGTALANQQDSLIKLYAAGDGIDKGLLRDMKRN